MPVAEEFFSVISSFAIILTRQIKLVALLWLSSWCLVDIGVLWLFLTVPWDGLKCVIVILPDHTHLLFETKLYLSINSEFDTKPLYYCRSNCKIVNIKIGCRWP